MSLNIMKQAAVWDNEIKRATFGIIELLNFLLERLDCIKLYKRHNYRISGQLVKVICQEQCNATGRNGIVRCG